MKLRKVFQNNPWIKGEQTTEFTPIDFGFIFGLNLPLIIIHSYFKWSRVSLYGQIDGALDLFEIFKADLLFHCAYIMLAFGMLGLCKTINTKVTSFIIIQLLGLSAFLLEFCAHNYYMTTGTLLNYDLIEYSLTNLTEVQSVVTSTGSKTSLFVFLLSLVMGMIGPWAVGYGIITYRDYTGSLDQFKLAPRKRWSIAILLVMAGMLLLTPSLTNRNILFTKNLTFHLLHSYFEDILSAERDSSNIWIQPVGASLEHHQIGKKRNLVLIILESTRSDATSLYSPGLETTPFLKSIGEKSIVAKHAYAVIPHTSKSLVALHCGIEPKITTPIEETDQNGIPVKCLPELLGEAGYKTVFFQTATEHFEKRRKLVQNFGYSEFHPGNLLPKRHYEPTNYFGYEDKILLSPSRKWHLKRLKENSHRPFMAAYLTNTAHHNYTLPSTHQYQWFHPNGFYNLYLNSINYVDSFLSKLIQDYKDMGIYHNTIFIFIGDHGEAFREHDIYGHSNIVYREGIQIPFIIHDPLRFQVGLQIQQPVFQPDVLPTVASLLNFSLINSVHRGQNILKKIPERRLHASCWNEKSCLTSFDGNLKYIHFFHEKPDEFYDLKNDKKELNNIHDQISPQILADWKKSALNWYQNNKKFYEAFQGRELASKTEDSKYKDCGTVPCH